MESCTGQTNLHQLMQTTTQPWEPVAISQGNGKKVTFALCVGTHPEHAHERTEHILVYQGEVTLRIRGQVDRILREGDEVIIPKGAEHSLESPTKSFILMIESLPRRSTFGRSLSTLRAHG